MQDFTSTAPPDIELPEDDQVVDFGELDDLLTKDETAG